MLSSSEVDLLRKYSVTEEIIEKCKDDKFKKHLWDMLDLSLADEVSDFEGAPYVYNLKNPVGEVGKIGFKRKPTILDYYRMLEKTADLEVDLSVDPSFSEIANMVCEISDLSMDVFESLSPADVATIKHIYIMLREWPAAKVGHGKELIEMIYNTKAVDFVYPIRIPLVDPIEKKDGDIEYLKIRSPLGKDYVKAKDITSRKDKLEFIFRLVDIDRPYFENITLTDSNILELLAGKFFRPFQKTGLMLLDT